MTLVSGTRLGSYEVLAPIGAGGMGEVYRARDTRLGRDVAIKVLPDAFARDAERLARFEREAQILASLNHSNIAALYGLEEHNGTRYLVLEYVPGETLAENVKRGALGIEEALETCKQIAEALEAAHEKGIVHRDLKPANIKITPEGKVKVLDFGLAKETAVKSAASDLSNSPTLTAYTKAGVILGTAAYMSPEQARGRPVDKRADIWAFGCLLYECLTGRQPFGGDTVTDRMAAIIRSEPDWLLLPSATPPAARRLLRRSLQKDPQRRLHDAGDARMEIEEALAELGLRAAGEVSVPARVPSISTWRSALPWALTALFAIAAAATFWLWKSAPAPPLVRFNVPLPDDAPLALARNRSARPLAVSADGTRIAYEARHGSSTQIYVRTLREFAALPVAGTEGGFGPFFSPDGQWLGFFADGKLKKIPLAGGPPLALADAPSGFGASWGPDDTIVFTPAAFGGLYRVSAGGGAPQLLTTPDVKQGERIHVDPQFLPGGKAVLFTIFSATGYAANRIAAVWLDNREQRVVMQNGAYARYLPGGHLVYMRSQALLAVPFTLKDLRAAGNPVPLVEGIRVFGDTAHFAVSDNGLLVYAPSASASNDYSLVWVERNGKETPVTAARREYEDLHLSPDGRYVALTIEGDETDVWVYEFARESFARLTAGGGNRDPLWTPDGKRLVYNAAKASANLFWRPVDGSAPEERLTTSESAQYPTGWTPDGRLLVFSEFGRGLWILPYDRGAGKPRPLVAETTDHATLSRDGRWLALEAGGQVYVQPFPGPGPKVQVSTEGGYEPLWSPDGRELFYREGAKIMAAQVTISPTLSASRPKPLFEGPYRTTGRDYDITPDGKRFIMIRGEQQSDTKQLHGVLNWFEEVKQKAR